MAQHLDTIPNVGAGLPTLYKERLIERLAYHDLLFKSYLPHVSYNLFCEALRHIKLYKCQQVDDHFLTLLGQARCQLEEELDMGIPSITDQELGSLAENCPNLKKLDLSGAKAVGKEALIKLFQGCTRLQNLDLSYSSRLAQACECQALWTLPQSLKELSLCGVLIEDEQVFVEGLQRLRCLSSVRLCGVPALTDATLSQVLETIGPNLESLDISGGFSKSLTDEGLRAVSKYCVKLQELCLSLLSQVTGVTLVPVFQTAERALNFRKLYLSCRMLDASVLSVVAATCHELRLLEISGVVLVNDELLYQLAENCHQLSHLGIKGCRQIAHHDKCLFSAFASAFCWLRASRLVLSGIHSLTDQCIFTLANSCPLLEEIYLNGCAQISPAAVRVETAFLKDLEPERQASSATIVSSSIDEQELSYVLHVRHKT
nr:hypothetical protein BaRGS_030857 [Batillaria attramentaria]